MNTGNAPAVLCLAALLVLSLLAGCNQYAGSGQQLQNPLGPAAQQEAGIAQGGAGNGAMVPAGKNPYASTDTIERSIALLMARYNKAVRPTVRVLSDTNSLRARQPAVFSNAKDGMLLVTWDDLLVVYDPATSQVVQELQISSMGV